MEMTVDEICRNYSQAANKSAQVGILADLNLTTKTEISNILTSCGYCVKLRKAGGRKSKIWTPERIQAFNTYYEQGMSANQMAPLLGVARESIRKRMLRVKNESAPQLGEQLQGEVK